MPGILLVTFLLAVALSEWYVIAVEAIPQDISRYPFGSEPAIDIGGLKYQSAETYVTAMQIDAVLSLSILVAFVIATRFRSAKATAGSYFLLATLVYFHVTSSTFLLRALAF